MVRITARYDGKVLIPDGPLTLPRDVAIEIMVPSDTGSDSNGKGTGNGAASGVLRLAGLGADAWVGVDAVEFQRREREGWE